MIQLLTLLLSAAVAPPAAADVAAVARFVAEDRSYSVTGRVVAEKRLRDLPAAADAAAFELEAARIVALADNGHSAYFPAQWTTRYPRSEIRFALFADGLFVIAASEPGLQSLVGKRVVTLNGHPWQDIRRAYSRYQGGLEGFKDQFFVYFAETPALLRAAGFGSDDQQVRIGLEGGREAVAKARIAPLRGEAAMLGEPHLRVASPLIKNALPLYLRSPEELYAFAELPALDAAYVRLDAIGGEGLEAFLASTLSKLRAGEQRNIILDLRMNMGGDLNRSRDFARSLPQLAKGGRVYAITSGRTFSAAISTLGYLKQSGRAKVTIVGEPVGDRLEFWAEGGIRELPGLGARMLLARERHNYRKGCSETDCHAAIRKHPIAVASLQPDIAAPMRFADYAAGRDPSMVAIAVDIAKQSGARGTIYHYVRSNRDGSNTENVVQFRPTRKEVAVYKWMEKCTTAAFVTATMNDSMLDGRRFVAGKVARDGSQAAFGTLTLDGSKLKVDITPPGGSRMTQSWSVPTQPYLLYDFDLADLNAYLQDMRPRSDFSYRLAVVWPSEKSLFQDFGQLTARFRGEETRLGRPAMRFELRVEGPRPSTGNLWIEADEGFIIDAELGLPNHEGYEDFRLQLHSSERGGADAWSALLRAHHAGCEVERG